MLTKIRTLRELFGICLRYAYDGELKLVEKGLPEMIEAAGSPELQAALNHHLQETKGQLVRLEQVFRVVGMEPDTKGNDIMDELMSAAKDSAGNIETSSLRDVALIMNGNEVEHYEIAMYGSLIALARNLGFDNAAGLLEETLKEEKAADAKLTQIAQTAMNQKAAREHAA